MGLYFHQVKLDLMNVEGEADGMGLDRGGGGGGVTSMMWRRLGVVEDMKVELRGCGAGGG